MLELSHVTKRFGTRTVVDDLCLTVPDHCIFGFVGENGAGKTTTMKMILGLLDTDAGEIRVHGEQVSFGKSRANHFIGYLPDVPEFYGFLTPEEYLLLCGEISGISKKEGKERAKELLALVGLSKTKQRIQGFSRGMKQRLGIAQALFGNPKLLICDEPTSALDPAGRREILELLHSLKERTTVLFSTHILSDVERICDECAVLHKGKLVKQGLMQELKNAGGAQGFLIEFLRAEDAEKFAGLMPGGTRTSTLTLAYGTKENACVSIQKVDTLSASLPEYGNDIMSAAMSLLVREGIAVRRIEQKERTLEEMFFRLVDGEEESGK